MLLRCFDPRQKKNICKFRLRFCKSVQTFNAKEVCHAFWTDLLRKLLFLRVFAVAVFFDFCDVNIAFCKR